MPQAQTWGQRRIGHRSGTHYPGAAHRAVRRERIRWFNDEKFLAVDYRITLWTHGRDAMNPVRL
ncbi:hypothetical protein FHX45_002950 [Amycolatopsis granulosa]|nr:hypothetical protein [Amycolatopsis granulosa]